MLFKRVLTVAVLLPLFLAALFWLPSLYWGILLTLILALASWEWGRLCGFGTAGRIVYTVVLTALAIAILFSEHGADWVTAFIHTRMGQVLYAFAAAFWMGIAPAWLFYHWQVRNRWLLAVIGAIVLLPFWHALNWLQAVPFRLLIALGVVWVADTAAYFAGRRFGKRKLAPHISPGKTWAGVWGAFIAVAIYWILVSRFIPQENMQFFRILLLVFLITALSIVGDLFESWMKRVAGVKDSGELLPGHGGVLDRVDGLSAALPLTAIYFAYPLT
jgi:phosphatidate cytidylyltransferase